MNQTETSPLPPLDTVVQAGAFGAVLGGVTSGVMEAARVRHGDITSRQAVEHVAKNTAQSAVTMAIASVAAHVVRAHPIFGYIALAGAGVGAVMMLSAPKKQTRKANDDEDRSVVDATDLPEDSSATTAKAAKAASRRTATAGKPA